MKTKLFNFIIIGTLLVTGVVSAQVEAFSTPVHTGGYEQKKEGSFVASFLKAGLKALPTGIPSLAGFIIADKVISSPQGFFNTIILPVNNKGAKVLEPQLRIGTNSSDLLNATFKNDAPVTVDLSGRNTTDAVALLADPTVCTPNVSVISTNTSAFHFWSGVASGGNNDRADIIARQIQLSGGSPGAGKVLISVDSQGTATWATVRVDVNGVATYDYTQSPVPTGLCAEQVIPGCMDPLATNPTPGATVDDGSCVFDVCTNLTGTQETVPTGPTGVNWTVTGTSCIPDSCDTAIIGTKILGETVVKGNSCPTLTFTARVTGPVNASQPAVCDSAKMVTPAELTFSTGNVPIEEFDSITFEVALKNKTTADQMRVGEYHQCVTSRGDSSYAPNRPKAFQDFSFVPLATQNKSGVLTLSNHALTTQKSPDWLNSANIPRLVNAFRKNGTGKYYIEISQNICGTGRDASYQGPVPECNPFDLIIRVKAVYKGQTFTKDVIIGKNQMQLQTGHNPYGNIDHTNMSAAKKYCFKNTPQDSHYHCAQVRYP